MAASGPPQEVAERILAFAWSQESVPVVCRVWKSVTDDRERRGLEETVAIEAQICFFCGGWVGDLGGCWCGHLEGPAEPADF